ncbi:MAG: RHS repeat domain-containing protein [Gammaproteobacteria bacterium]
MGNRTQDDTFDPQGALSRTHQRLFDRLNRLKNDIGADNQSTEYRYDPNGNPTDVVDPLLNTTTFFYDRLNRMTQARTPPPGSPATAMILWIMPGGRLPR